MSVPVRVRPGSFKSAVSPCRVSAGFAQAFQLASMLRHGPLNPMLVELETPDAECLLDLARAGDARAFGELCRAYETRLLRHAMTLCGNAAAAEDLAQDTLVEAWKCLRRYNGQCLFFTWLCAILLNRHRNACRRRLPAPTDSDESQDRLAHLPDHRPGPDHEAQISEQSVFVWQCVQALPDKQRQVIYLRFYAEDSLKGIAAALGCSVGTVKSRLFNALDKLRGMNAARTLHSQAKGEPL